ncbi:glycosyltransferase family 2 protein [Phnomibacter ginsenosidimutans]|uniref:Glycosyltransferase n=1 Tax=Phnomibacter ginsenosidimutans TaxID=2676868 RepID=A0A6I6GRY7_9BACT|nr:glycosyltransferase family A protein [Phnomibacter ginsenosidimutans]QGW29722.1 glycosyltransferase [Phnomibacter ginsenosidimutans]
MPVQYSIVIPTYKRNHQLALCLQRLQPAAQSLEASLYEVIVTDDAADAATEQLLLTQFPWATYTAGPHRGPAANRNHGASLAIGEWLVFTDDDCLPDAQWLQAYADAIELHPDCKAFEGAILPDDWALLKKTWPNAPSTPKAVAFGVPISWWPIRCFKNWVASTNSLPLPHRKTRIYNGAFNNITTLYLCSRQQWYIR